jgi:hypothetical protein
VAELELARGRQREAWAAIAQAERMFPAYGLHSRALMALTPFLELSQAELRALRSTLAGQRSETTRDSTRQLYLLGLLSARLEDAPGALSYVAQLESRASALAREDSARASSMARGLALTVRADVARRRAFPAEALALLERGRLDRWWTAAAEVVVPDPLDPDSPRMTLSYERWMRAELLAGLGHTREAIHWYAGLGVMHGQEAGYLAPSRLRMAEMYERLGEREQAAEQYARFIRLWKDCDPELRPLVEDARRRLARLTEEDVPSERTQNQ